MTKFREVKKYIEESTGSELEVKEFYGMEFVNLVGIKGYDITVYNYNGLITITVREDDPLTVGRKVFNQNYKTSQGAIRRMEKVLQEYFGRYITLEDIYA